MNLPKYLALFAACVGGLVFSSCARETEKEAEVKAPPPSVTFKAGRGLQVSPATLAVLQIKTAPAEERELASDMKIIAQVFDPNSPARASVLVATGDAERIAAGQPVDATLQRQVRTAEASLHQVELIYSLPGREVKLGDFVEIRVHQSAAKALAVQRSAVIDGASGPFVYVVNGDSYLKTAVKVGAQDANWIEITDGLYAGDVVVVHAAQKLWLAEMLLTKGGGDID